eukprot:s3915_g6.t1
MEEQVEKELDEWKARRLRRWVGSGGDLGRRPVAVAPCFFCLAGVAFGDTCFTFVWQAWRFVTSGLLSCGRRGTYGTGLALAAALVRAWSAGRRDAVPLLRGRGGAWRHLLHFCVCQAWHFVTSALLSCANVEQTQG